MQHKSPDEHCRCGAPVRLLEPDLKNHNIRLLICTICNLPCDSCECDPFILSEEEDEGIFEPSMM
jgi:hypothetical protein